jgi:hypothetical protein
VKQAEGLPVRTWFTREPLVLGKEWNRIEFGSYKAFVSNRPGVVVFAIMNGTYSLFFELPEDSAVVRRFVSAFDRRFSVFFANAAGDAELSFPAYVDIPG